MSKEIINLEPKLLWEHFYSLTQIARPSKKEEKIIEFIKKFGEDLGLETKVDSVGNVVIRKPATPGMEDRKTVTLQGHLDMVPQKNSDIEFDFEKDAIDAYIDGEWVTARGTTLGADNGMGVAAAMAVLTSDDIKHGPIEAFFTVDEETGMTGAFALKDDFLKGDVLLNMDSEDEGELYVGCAGGIDVFATFDYTEESIDQSSKAYKIEISGLKGGHSGLDIHLGKGNANKLLTRYLWHATKEHGLRIAYIEGGNLRNAIPREAYAIVTIPSANTSDFENCVNDFDKTYKNEISSVDPDVKLKATLTDMPEKIIDENTQNGLLNGLYGCPHGVIGMLSEMPDVVETSTSLGVIKMENGQIEVISLTRSSVDSFKEYTGNMIKIIFELAGAKVKFEGSYPGWKPNLDSPILKTMKEGYNSKFGKIPAIKVIHAGLECGLIGDVYPNMDLISFGPTIRYPHSPDEKVNIATVKKFWDFLVVTLENISKK
ncbi:MAG: aminoacyl-histidine dipeptidase [Bacteroidota bacterium]|nr:aminoacyl-histidine dipeptidase [Bacteroidota bacterium]